MLIQYLLRTGFVILYSPQLQILTDNFQVYCQIFSDLTIWSRPDNLELQIGQSCSNSSVARSINCKTALPWLGIGEFSSNTPWLRLRVFEPNSPQPRLRRGGFTLELGGASILILMLRSRDIVKRIFEKKVFLDDML